jgi:hypothetical protein
MSFYSICLPAASDIKPQNIFVLNLKKKKKKKAAPHLCFYEEFLLLLYETREACCWSESSLYWDKSPRGCITSSHPFREQFQHLFCTSAPESP